MTTLATVAVDPSILRPHGIVRANPAGHGERVRTGEIVKSHDTFCVFVGITPAGCVWVTSSATKVERQRTALAQMWARTSSPLSTPNHNVVLVESAS